MNYFEILRASTSVVLGALSPLNALPLFGQCSFVTDKMNRSSELLLKILLIKVY